MEQCLFIARTDFLPQESTSISVGLSAYNKPSAYAVFYLLL